MRSYTFPAIAERGTVGYGAAFPDLPGCVTAADTPAALAEMAREALSLHLAGMVEDGQAIPEPTAIERLPHDPEVAEVGVMLVTATLGAAGEVALELSPEALRRADATAASSGRTRERVLSDGLERLFAAQ